MKALSEWLPAASADKSADSLGTELSDAQSTPALIQVEVVYALPRFAELVTLKLPAGSTVRAAIEASGLLARYPELQPENALKVGIHAKVVKLDQALRDRDRVELYRPLIADPKAVRKKRADEGKAAKVREKRGAGADVEAPAEG